MDIFEAEWKMAACIKAKINTSGVSEFNDLAKEVNSLNERGMRANPNQSYVSNSRFGHMGISNVANCFRQLYCTLRITHR